MPNLKRISSLSSRIPSSPGPLREVLSRPIVVMSRRGGITRRSPTRAATLWCRAANSPGKTGLCLCPVAQRAWRFSPPVIQLLLVPPSRLSALISPRPLGPRRSLLPAALPSHLGSRLAALHPFSLSLSLSLSLSRSSFPLFPLDSPTCWRYVSRWCARVPVCSVEVEGTRW